MQLTVKKVRLLMDLMMKEKAAYVAGREVCELVDDGLIICTDGVAFHNNTITIEMTEKGSALVKAILDVRLEEVPSSGVDSFMKERVLHHEQERISREGIKKSLRDKSLDELVNICLDLTEENRNLGIPMEFGAQGTVAGCDAAPERDSTWLKEQEYLKKVDGVVNGVVAIMTGSSRNNSNLSASAEELARAITKGVNAL